jgi:hypothetical protein
VTRTRTTREGALAFVHHPGPPAPDPTAATVRMPRVTSPIRTSSGQHELYLAYVIHSPDPLELREISDAISATVTRETAGRATVRQETRITSPIRTTIDTTIVDSTGAGAA